MGLACSTIRTSSIPCNGPRFIIKVDTIHENFYLNYSYVCYFQKASQNTRGFQGIIICKLHSSETWEGFYERKSSSQQTISVVIYSRWFKDHPCTWKWLWRETNKYIQSIGKRLSCQHKMITTRTQQRETCPIWLLKNTAGHCSDHKTIDWKIKTETKKKQGHSNRFFDVVHPRK